MQANALCSYNVTITVYHVLPRGCRERIAAWLWRLRKLRPWLYRHGLLPDRLGRQLSRETSHNLVTTAGLNLIRDAIYGDTIDGIGYMAVGTGTNAPAASDTTLQTEVFRDALTTKTKVSAGLETSYYLASTDANGNTLTEVGMFNAAAAGTLYARTLLATSIPKTAGIACTFEWNFAWASA